MAVDPRVVAVFGPPPANINLEESSNATNDSAVLAMLVLAAVSVIVRFITRITFKNPILWDDLFIVLALLCIATTAGISISGGKYGGSGYHVWGLTLEQLEKTYYLLYIYPFIYAGACTSTRISILYFYRRIFSPLEPWMKWATIFGWSQTLMYPIYLWACMIWACSPRKYFWLQFGGTVTGTCINIPSFFIGAGILNMLNDFILLCIPFPRIIKLQMSIRKKVAICCIMAVGFFACVASIIRIWVLVQYTKAVDVTWAMGPLFIWSTIEPSVAIVTACLPHLAPLFKLATQKLTSYDSSEMGTGERLGSKAGGQKLKPWPNRSRSASRGPHFDFGLTTLGQDDEIGLTNHVGAPSNENINSSIASEGGVYNADRAITVKSSFVQTISDRPYS